MKIAVLNECFFEEEHLARLRNIAEVIVFPNTSTEHDAIERMKGADIVITDGAITPLNNTVISSAKNVKLLALSSTGFDKLDVTAARAQGIAVANVPGYSTDAVAEHVFALLFAVNKHIVSGDYAARAEGLEVEPGNAAHQIYLGSNLRGKTLGIIGFGNIGRRVAQIAQGLGMTVIAYNRTPREADGVIFTSMDEVLSDSDVVSLNIAAYTNSPIITARELALMKPSAVLINTTRAKLIDTEALLHTLQSHRLAGAGLDCIDVNPGHAIFSLTNVVFSPHSAWFTKEALSNIGGIITDNVEAFARGEKKNIVN